MDHPSTLDQDETDEEVLTSTVSDEALEAAAVANRGGFELTLFTPRFNHPCC